MPETRFCFRCGEDVPALTEDEVAHILPLWAQAVRRSGHGSAFDVIKASRTDPAFAEVAAEHERITGRGLGSRCLQAFHRLSDFGPACPSCGRSLRTAQARQCFSCGWRREA